VSGVAVTKESVAALEEQAAQLVADAKAEAATKLQLQTDEMAAMCTRHKEEVAGKDEEIVAGIVLHLCEIVALNVAHESEVQVLCTALSDSEEQLHLMQHHCAKLAGEVANANANMQQLAFEKAGVFKAAPGSLLQQMRLKRERADALREAERLQSSLVTASAKLKQVANKRSDETKKHESGVIGPRLLAKGGNMLEQLSTDSGRKAVVEASAVGQGAEVQWPDEELRRKNQILQHLEIELFAAARGDFNRAHLLIAALIERPAVKAALQQVDRDTARGQKAMHAMLEHARNTLASLQTGGTKMRNSHLSFEASLSVLIPDNADELQIMSELARLLDVDRGAVRRSMKRSRAADGDYDGFVSVLFTPRKRRKDFIALGRQVAAEYWHAMTRVDTRPGRKVRIRVDVNEYVEHWRHVQYMSDWEMAVLFFSSSEYKTYLELSKCISYPNGQPFKEDIFYMAKCKCIKPSDDEECSCPHCTVFREAVRSYHKQRVQWHRKAKAEGKACTNCACTDPSFHEMSKSSTMFRTFMHRACGKVAHPALMIRDGPKAAQEAPTFYRRQCCRLQLPELKEAMPAVREADAAAAAAADAKAAKSTDANALAAKANKAMATATRLAGAARFSVSEVRNCDDCRSCGFDVSMPRCPIEWENGAKTAVLKDYRPRPAPDGQTIQNELRDIPCSRAELMEHLGASFKVVDPHLFTDEWTSHQRDLVYATLLETELAISTDFSAQYEHKAAWTSTCEHPPRSNIDVFVVTRARIVDGRRIYMTDVWRIISAAKGSAGFHNKALSQLIEWYRHVMELCLAWLFTDGCRGQYKGKRNFRRISTFAHEHSATSFELLQPPHLTFTSEAPIPDAVSIAVARATDGANATASSASIEAIAQQVGASVDMQLQPQASKAPKDWGTFKIHTVRLRHLFACGHHFKGPHDGFGKDAKHCPRCAEKQQKVRIASTHELYHFDAMNLPCPRRNVLASEIVAALAPAPTAALQPRSEQELPADWCAVLSPCLRSTDPVEDAIATQLGKTAVVHTPSPATVADLELYQHRMCSTAELGESQTCFGASTEEHEQGSVSAEGLVQEELTIQPPSDGLQPELDTSELGEEEVDVDVDDPNGRVDSSVDELQEPDSEAEECAGDFDFEFDETGARVTREEQLEDTGGVASPSSAEGLSGVMPQQLQPPTKAARKSRTVRIAAKAVGGECRDGGEERIITQKHRAPGIFTASSYFWLYYAVYPASGVSIVPVGTVAGPNEAHGILDPCENYDADAVANSNSTYEFAGVDVDRPGLLYDKTLPCVAPCCREVASISLVNTQCPFWATTGRWCQNTVNAIANVPMQQLKQRMNTELFRAQMLQQPPVALYAVYADPRRLEAGQHPYWLVETTRHPYAAPRGLKDVQGATITIGTYIVDVYWFKCTSNDPNHKAYKKLDVLEPTSEERNANEKDVDASCSVVHLKMKAFITETCLEWAHFSPRLGTGVFADESHLRLMRHNFSNVMSP